MNVVLLGLLALNWLRDGSLHDHCLGLSLCLADTHNHRVLEGEFRLETARLIQILFFLLTQSDVRLCIACLELAFVVVLIHLDLLFAWNKFNLIK